MTQRRVIHVTHAGLLLLLVASSCSSLPGAAEYHEYLFPAASAYPGVPSTKHVRLGVVSAKVNYPSLSPSPEHQRDEAELCRNYFNKAVTEMVALAQKKGGDAVIEIRSQVTYQNGKQELMMGPECTDDGAEGQVVTQAIVVKWLK